jgi:hypothetical protein
MLVEYSIVKVIKLLKPNRDFSGSENISRAPQIGDTGTIVHVYDPSKACIVEMVGAGGLTIWLADFESEELEAL